MTKPLELNTFPLWESLGGTMYTGDTHDDVVNVDYEVYRKRLTGPELAAEWQYQDNRCGQKCEGYGVAHDGTSMGSEEDEIDRLRTVYRFATLPHYDEAPDGPTNHTTGTL